MTIHPKILLSFGALAGYDLACRLVAPPAQLASNHTVIQQMDGSNASALAVHLLGSGDWAHGLLLLGLALALAGIWLRKAR